jgi:hypothetical protein
MEEGQAGYQSSEDGSHGSGSASNRCNDDMISVQFMQKVQLLANWIDTNLTHAAVHGCVRGMNERMN